MFRISQFMQEILAPKPLGPKRNPPGPVVIWNLVRRCNLMCKHCYSISADTDFPNELNTQQVFEVMDDLKQFRVPVLILSGGEPLLRPDIFEIAHRAKAMGFYTALSTNGTLIDERNIDKIAAVGFDYLGISIDGIRETHDRFRRKEGAYEESMHGLRLCRDAGIKVGLRFTMTQDNAEQLPQLLDLMVEERINKFYFSHLNYAGRGNKNREDDVFLNTTRWAMDLLFERALEDATEGRGTEFVTGNNDADGVYLLRWVERRFPEQAEHIGDKLIQWGGNSSGVNIANIDNQGRVHPDTMWWDYDLGNVKQRPFSEIWQDTSDPIMAGLKQSPRKIGGRCGQCHYFNICGGNTRVRARQLTGDAWSEDPACYLTDKEIGIEVRVEDDGPEDRLLAG
ncbi:heme d1 biosynthesis radical SAM protein NirJ [endosymbiont of Ridgeia piscesae]|uniref:Pre-heme d1 synthase n=3 Tax=endosymbiont of Ridgeia piscesae TaxID=54398 RepID=A0A0T5YU49_9GAMM|nr:heme d1 biosynthesis radical SAM protein NirJ [endosymbiont of Ridgeia piscesae]KRT53910.1 heme d1 biosynthesis radical SAM protein NirJ [endosymbiont of Ridgeia piscesae]